MAIIFHSKVTLSCLKKISSSNSNLDVEIKIYTYYKKTNAK